MDTADRIRMYLRDEVRLPEAEADARAADLMAIFGAARGAVVAGAVGVRSLADRWGLFLLRGILAILFGVLTIWHPLAAIAALVLVFGVWAFIDGLNALVLAFTGKSWELGVIGVLGIGAGLVTLFRPELTAITLYAIIAGWSIARGVIEIVMAIKLRKQIEGEAWLILAGVVSVIFGALLIALPAAGMIALLWLISFYAFLFGGLMLALAFRLRRVKKGEGGERRQIPIRRAPQPV